MPSTKWTGGWMGQRFGLEALKKWKISWPCQEPNLNYSFIYPVHRLPTTPTALSHLPFYSQAYPEYMCYSCNRLYSSHFWYTGCNRRNRPDFGRVFLMLNYTKKPQNTYIQSWTVWEIMEIENCGLPLGPRKIAVSWDSYLLVGLRVTSPLNIPLWCVVLRNRKYKYDTNARNFAVTINGSMSLTSYFDEKYRY